MNSVDETFCSCFAVILVLFALHTHLCFCSTLTVCLCSTLTEFCIPTLLLLLQATGMDAGMAGNFVQATIFMGICVGWVSTYLWRVANKVGGSAAKWQW
jgi:hypothetical protein